MLFTKTFSKIFQSSYPGLEAARVLMKLQQGAHSLSDYAINFCTLAADSWSNDSSLWVLFTMAYHDTIQDLLVAPEQLPDLDSLVALAIKLHNHVREAERDQRQTSTPKSPSTNMLEL